MELLEFKLVFGEIIMYIGRSGSKDHNPNELTVQKRCRFFTAIFWDGVGTKIVETLISVKVWGLVATTSISTWLLLNEYIMGGEWVTLNTCVYATIFGVREIYKIARVNGGDDMNGQDTP